MKKLLLIVSVCISLVLVACNQDVYLELLKKAQAGDMEAQYQLGMAYSSGRIGLQQDSKKALEWYTKAANQGNVQAQFKICVINENTLGVPHEIKKSMECYLKAAEQGYALAQFRLGQYYFYGENIPYEYGGLIPHDFNKATEWYTKAANQGYSLAQQYLGSIYASGEYITQDYNKAAEWYIKAASQGNYQAQTNLSRMYYEGVWAPQDDKIDKKFYTSSLQGVRPEGTIRGDKYARGDGVPKDYEFAIESYTIAANHGHDKAMVRLGDMYFNGKGVPKDYQKAIEWYTKAAITGEPETFYKLGKAYLKAKPSDMVAGCAWTYLSKDLKNSTYCDKHLNQAQITSTLILMEELKKKISSSNTFALRFL